VVDLSGAKLSKRSLADAAEIKTPSQRLRQLLGYLAHPLPEDLADASKEEILSWAMDHWSIQRLKDMGPIAIAISTP
jgi:glutamyl-Q tRNA(Asp) synthetase